MLPEKEKFVIEDDLAAKWAVDKIREKQCELNEMKQWYESQYQKCEYQITADIGYLQALLRDYLDKVKYRQTPTGMKKYKLPNGELIWKPPALDYQRDEELLLKWLEQNHPELLKTIQKPMWSEVKRLITETGEIPDGVTPIETQERFEVKIAKGSEDDAGSKNADI